ncbi:MAG: ferredoxin--NADP reductase [Deltaproteobacteria bacterium]|nr:ferredoxin--NADP reductase [Deltaproteobacteria bacterium]
MATELNAKVTGKIELAPGNFILRVAPDNWPLFDFKAGQYCVLGLPGGAPRSSLSDPEKEAPDPDKFIKRAYSIASSSVEKQYVEFYISLVRSGALSPRLYNLKIGDQLWLSQKPTGFLTLENVPPDVNVVLIATGTGLAPYMSMIRTLVTNEGFNKRYAVIHGSNHSWDLGYQSELHTLDRLSPQFSYFPIISKPEEEPVKWNGSVGFVDAIWKDGTIDRAWGFHPTPQDTHIFLCGNPLMIDFAVDFLGKEGFREGTRKEPKEIHLERFW